VSYIKSAPGVIYINSAPGVSYINSAPGVSYINSALLLEWVILTVLLEWVILTVCLECVILTVLLEWVIRAPAECDSPPLLPPQATGFLTHLFHLTDITPFTHTDSTVVRGFFICYLWAYKQRIRFKKGFMYIGLLIGGR
jgi:hypothetical protein